MTDRGRRPFYGWVVVAALFVMLTTSAGLGFYALTLYLETLTTERGFGVSSVSGATAVFFLASGGVGVLVGRLIARRDPRPVIAVGAVLCASSILALGSVGSLWQVYVTYALFGAGFACCSLVPSTTLVARWFHRRRSVALSISSTGLSVGGILLTPIAASLVERNGLRETVPLLAAAFIIGTVPVTALLLRADPAKLGLLPDGDPVPVGGVQPAGGVLFADAVRTRLFRAITVAWACCLLAQVGGIAHLFNLVSRRVDRPTAALAVSVMAGASFTGRLLGGWILTRVQLRTFSLAIIAVQVAGLTALGNGGSRLVLLLSAALFGAAVGNVLLLQPVLLADVFGVLDYPRIFSRSQLIATFGTAAGPFVVGAVFDVGGGYRPAYMVAGAISAVGAAVLASGGPLVEPQ